MEAAAAFKHPRLRLGALLLRNGLLSAEQLAEALEEREQTGIRIGEIVVRRGWVSDEDLARTLAEQFAIDFVDLGAVTPDPGIDGLLSAEVARRLRAVPIGVSDGAAVVAVADPTGETIETLTAELHRPVRLAVAPASAIDRAIERLDPAPDAGDTPEPTAWEPSGIAPFPAAAFRSDEPAGPPEPGPQEPAPEEAAPEEPEAYSAIEWFEPPAAVAPPEVATESDTDEAPAEPEEVLASITPFELRRPLLGTLLLRDGLITPQQLAEALIEKEETEERLGEIVLRRGWISDVALSRLLAEQFAVVYVDLDATPPDDRAMRLLSAALARYFWAVPVRFLDNDSVLVAIADPTAFGVEDLERALGFRVVLGLATESAVEAAIERIEAEEETARPRPVVADVDAPEASASADAPEELAAVLPIVETADSQDATETADAAAASASMPAEPKLPTWFEPSIAEVEPAAANDVSSEASGAAELVGDEHAVEDPSFTEPSLDPDAELVTNEPEPAPPWSWLDLATSTAEPHLDAEPTEEPTAPETYAEPATDPTGWKSDDAVEPPEPADDPSPEPADDQAVEPAHEPVDESEEAGPLPLAFEPETLQDPATEIDADESKGEPQADELGTEEPLEPIAADGTLVEDEPEPIEDGPQPIAAADAFAEDDTEPIEDEPQPIEDEPQPIAAADAFAEDDTETIEDEPQPIEDEPQPIAAADAFAEDDTETIEDEPQPIEDEPQPIAAAEAFVEDEAEPVAWGEPEEHALPEAAVEVSEPANEPQVTELVDGLLKLALEEGASDLHFEPQANQLVVRARVDGLMQQLYSAPAPLAESIVARLELIGGLDVGSRHPRDQHATFSLDTAEIDARVTIAPTSYGDRVVLRFARAAEELALDRLGLASDAVEQLARAIALPYGAVIACGPRESGTTTTLYAVLQDLDAGGRCLMTIEDPIARRLPGVAQIQVDHAAELTFAQGLRTILASDPDVVLVGDVRDSETACTAIEAAVTGQLVLAAMRADDIRGAVSRLVDMGVGRELLAAATNCLVAQRLARRLCLGCREPYDMDVEELLDAGAREADLPVGGSVTLYRAAGCDECADGYRGRVAMFETLLMSSVTRRLLETGTAEELYQAAVAGGMRTLQQDGLRLCLLGHTSIDEISRVAGTPRP